VLVEEDRPVGVPVVGEPDVGVGRPDQPAEVGQVLRDWFRVPPREVPVRLGVDRHDLTAQFPEDAGAGDRAGTVAGVDGDRQVGVRDGFAVDGREQLLDVQVGGVVDVRDLARLVPGDGREVLGEEAFLDPFERPQGELDAVGADQFHAVVLRGIVRGSDHQPRDALAFAVGLQPRRREHPQPVDVGADAREAALGGTREHPPGLAGVPGQRGTVRVPDGPGGRGDLHDELRIEVLVCHAADATRPEDLHSPVRLPRAQLNLCTSLAT